MSNLPSKVSLNVATPKKTRKFYSQNHITTTDFMRPRPVFSREYIPGRNMKVTCFNHVKLDPLPTPTFGRCQISNRAFFVPYRAVSPDFNSFYTSSMYSYHNHVGVPTTVPRLDNTYLYKCITLDMTSGTSSDYDIKANENGTTV